MADISRVEAHWTPNYCVPDNSGTSGASCELASTRKLALPSPSFRDKVLVNAESGKFPCAVDFTDCPTYQDLLNCFFRLLNGLLEFRA